MFVLIPMEILSIVDVIKTKKELQCVNDTVVWCNLARARCIASGVYFPITAAAVLHSSMSRPWTSLAYLIHLIFAVVLLLILKNWNLQFLIPCVYLQFSKASFFYTMSALRLCGVLIRNTAIPSQQQRLPILVPIALKLKNQINAPQQQRQQSRGFKNFGHKPTPEPNVSQYYNAFIGIGIFICLLDWKWWELKRFFEWKLQLFRICTAIWANCKFIFSKPVLGCSAWKTTNRVLCLASTAKLE